MDMSKGARGRPSPAMIVAALALTFALAGTAIAADPVSKLNRSKVKKIANKQIDKRAPGLSVEKAKTADSATNAVNAVNATNAVNAANVGGVTAHRINYHANTGGGPTVVFQAGGVTLTASCPAGTTVVTATTTNPQSYLGSVGLDDTTDDQTTNTVEEEPFAPGDTVSLFPNGDTNQIGQTSIYSQTNNIQINWALDDLDPPNCEWAGVALVG